MHSCTGCLHLLSCPASLPQLSYLLPEISSQGNYLPQSRKFSVIGEPRLRQLGRWERRRSLEAGTESREGLGFVFFFKMLEIIADLYAYKNDPGRRQKLRQEREWRPTGAVVSLSKGRQDPQSIYKTWPQSKPEYISKDWNEQNMFSDHV